MGTAHGAEELGLCPHGLACQAGAWGRYIGFCLGYGHIRETAYWKCWQKYSARPITLSHDEILTNGFLHLNVERCRCGLRYRASESRNARASYWHILTYPFWIVLPLVLDHCNTKDTGLAAVIILVNTVYTAVSY